MTEILAIRPKRFIKASDYTGKTDIFLRISVNNTAHKTDIATEQDKSIIWKKSFAYKLTPQQVFRSDAVEIGFEAFFDDFGTEEAIGKVFVRLSQVKTKADQLNVFNIIDSKSKIVGKIEVEIELNPKNIVGTVVVKPTTGKFEGVVEQHQELYLVFIHGETGFQTDNSEVLGDKPVFRDVLPFQQLEHEDLTMKCFANTPNGNELIGEAQIPVSTLYKKGGSMSLVAYLVHNKKKVGDMHLELEFYTDTFKNPVNVYPLVTVKKGEYISKKVRYSNLEDLKKNMIVRSENPDIVYPRTEMFEILPNGFGEIRLKFVAPKGGKGSEEKVRVDILREDTRVIEESFLFRVKSI